MTKKGNTIHEIKCAACGKHIFFTREKEDLQKRIEELEAENERLREAFPKWQSGEELPELMGEMILIETITGGYRTGSFAGIHSSGAIRYNTFDGLTRTIYPANIVRWAYIKALKGAGE